MSTLLIITLSVVGTVIALIIIVAIAVSWSERNSGVADLSSEEVYQISRNHYGKPFPMYEQERKIPEEIKNYALYNGVSHMIDSPEARLTYKASLAALFDRNPNKWREDFYMGQKKISEMKKAEKFDRSVCSEIEATIELDRLLKSLFPPDLLEQVEIGKPEEKRQTKSTYQVAEEMKAFDQGVASGIALVQKNLPKKQPVKELDMDFETFNNVEKRGFNLAVDEMKAIIRDLDASPRKK